jgi:hypothetical protein
MASMKTSKSNTSSILIDRAWRLLVQPASIGLLLLVASLILLVGPMNAMPSSVTYSWWTTGYQAEGMARAAASLLAMAGVLGVGLLFNRWNLGKGMPSDAPSDGVKSDKSTWIPAIGLSLMTLGAVGAALLWMFAQTSISATNVSLPIGRTIEGYPAESGTGFMRVMLPSRLKVKSVDIEAGVAELELSKVGEAGVVQPLEVGRPVDIEGMRYALVGVEYDPRVVRGVFSSRDANTISATASLGDTFKVTVDGPEYKVTQVIRDYLNILGPAVEVESETTGRFWLFQRATPIKSFETPNGLQLDTLESAPVAIIGVSRGEPTELFGAAGIVFLLGLGLFLAKRDRVFGKTRDGEGAWSLNEAHSLEEVA